MPGVLLFRKPPGMLGAHNLRVDTAKYFSALPDFSPGRLDNDPLTLFDPFFFSRLRMDLHHRIFVKFPQPGYLAVFRVKKAGRTGTGDQNIRKLFRAVPAY